MALVISSGCSSRTYPSYAYESDSTWAEGKYYMVDTTQPDWEVLMDDDVQERMLKDNAKKEIAIAVTVMSLVIYFVLEVVKKNNW